jgi:hypothetical protein
VQFMHARIIKGAQQETEAVLGRESAGWRAKSLSLWRGLCHAPYEEVVTGGLFSTVLVIIIWLAIKLLWRP